MYPYLIDTVLHLPLFGALHVQLPSYGLMVAFAIAVGWVWLTKNARADGLDADAAAQATFWAVLGGMIGGKVGLLVVEAPSYLADPGQILSMDFVRAAGLIWTGVLGGTAGFVIVARRRGLPLARLLDAAAVPLPVCQAIGRVGCLLGGCCFGGRCDLPWAVVYHSAEAHGRTGVPIGVPLHPAPLYEALWSLAVVLPLLLLFRARAPRRVPGQVTLLYFALYGVGRFLVEYSRGDAIRGLWFGGAISTSQLLSLAIVPTAAVLWVWLARRARAAAPEPVDPALPGPSVP